MSTRPSISAIPVNVLSHGQSMPPERLEEMLAMGVREFRFSVDHIEPRAYAKIRRGGDLDRVLDTIAYLRRRKEQMAEINVEVNCILIGDTRARLEEFAEFWSDRVDAVHFHAEYYDVLKFRNLFFVPEKRNDCHIQLYVLPSGQVTPCCCYDGAIARSRYVVAAQHCGHLAAGSLRPAVRHVRGPQQRTGQGLRQMPVVGHVVGHQGWRQPLHENGAVRSTTCTA